MKRFRSAGILCLLMCLNYGLNAISIRLLARGSYLGVGATDAAIALVGFVMVKQVVAADTWLDKAGYTIGGIIGSMIGMWVTR